ncbi:unnamed protein product [Phytophthora lilii]|uniref:catechol O-methyltransferase n=1 Tax=Phytophthora lilii TaxID=2077276 RepID=A0A9W6WWF3_9STRA|nr:unnamed protein product [Phytophthora lilii]
MDHFAYEKIWMMNIGDVKGAIVDAEIEKAKPQVMAEIGAFCGYSAVRFASKLRVVSGPSAHFYSFEFSPHFANIASQIAALAGLSDVVTFFVGPFSETFTKLKEQGINHVDVRIYCHSASKWVTVLLIAVQLFFMDHDKRQYLSDFKMIEQSGLLKPVGALFFTLIIAAVSKQSASSAGWRGGRRQRAFAGPWQTAGLPRLRPLEQPVYVCSARVFRRVPGRAQGRRRGHHLRGLSSKVYAATPNFWYAASDACATPAFAS